MKKRTAIIWVPLIFLQLVTAAQLTTAPIFSDNMVLQRNMPVRIWGKAAPGKKVIFQFGGQNKEATTKEDSTAQIERDAIVIYTKEKPESIYYGWKPFTDANLVNAEGLPASTLKITVQ